MPASNDNQTMRDEMRKVARELRRRCTDDARGGLVDSSRPCVLPQPLLSARAAMPNPANRSASSSDDEGERRQPRYNCRQLPFPRRTLR